jgi:hypothetical protein
VPEWIHHPATWIIAIIAVAGLFGRLIYWMGTVDTDRKNFRTFMEEVRADIKQILHRLSPTTQTGSPVTLTALGRKIAEDIGAKDIAEGLFREFGQTLVGKLAYEVQEERVRYVLEDYEPPDEVKYLILDSAFEHGIDKEHVLRVIAVELRDRIFTEANQPIPDPPPPGGGAVRLSTWFQFRSAAGAERRTEIGVGAGLPAR